MTRDEILSMAREAGFVLDEAGFIVAPESRRIGWKLELERFALEVAAAEREVCAQIADEWATHEQKKYGNGGPGAAIRAR